MNSQSVLGEKMKIVTFVTNSDALPVEMIFAAFKDELSPVGGCFTVSHIDATDVATSAYNSSNFPRDS